MSDRQTGNQTDEESFDPVVISEQQFEKASRLIQHLKKGLVDFLKQPKTNQYYQFSHRAG